MITLSPFLWAKTGKNEGDKQAEALNRIISILLQGIALHSFNFDDAQFEVFERSIRKLRADFEHAPDEATALLSAGAAIRMLEEHSDAAMRYSRARQDEMEGVISVLSDTLLNVSDAAPDVRVRVKEIERDISLATKVSDIGEARARLAGCLADLRVESLLEPDAEAETKADSVTGLPDAKSAAQAISAIWKRRRDYFVAVLAVERLETINLRFGFQAGDQMLRLTSERIANQLNRDAHLFRWRGPCLAVLMHSQSPEAMVASEVSRLAATRIEAAVTARDREAILPISISWSLFPLAALRSVEDLVRQLNEFAASRTRTGKHVLAAAM